MTAKAAWARDKKRCANYVRFQTTMIRQCSVEDTPNIAYIRDQYKLLQAGVRKHVISYLAESAWILAGGEW